MNIKRLLNRRVLLTGCLIFILQLLCFAAVQLNDAGIVNQIAMNRSYNQFVDRWSKAALEQPQAAAEEFSSEEQRELREELRRKIAYLMGYPEEMEQIQANAKNLSSFSIFQANDSFSSKNVQKTAKDFEKMARFQPGLDRDRVTSHVISDSYVSFFVFAFMIYILYEMLREKENGMWELTHSMKRGRYQLAADRGGSLVVITVVSYAIMFGSNLLFSCLFYGADDFGGAIQTLEAYEKYPQMMSKGVYLLLLFLRNSLAMTAVVMVSYFLFVLVGNRNLAVVVLLIFLTVEWNLLKITPQSNWNMLRYLNLFELFDLGKLDQDYRNLDLFGRAISASVPVYAAGIVFFLASFLGAVIVYAKQYPRRAFGVWVRLAAMVQKWNQRVLAWLPVGMKEWYKTVILKKGLLFVAAGILVLRFAYGNTLVTYTDIRLEMDQSYRVWGGDRWEQFDQYVEELQEEYQQCWDEVDELKAQIKSGILGAESMEQILALERRANTIFMYLKEFTEKQELHQQVMDETGIETFAMSSRGYQEIFGQNSLVREWVCGAVLLVLTILFSARVFGLETSSHIKPVLRCSGMGIGWIWRMKIVCISLTVFAGAALFYLAESFSMAFRYGIPYLEAPIQSLTFLSGESINISVGLYWLLAVWFRIQLILAAMAATLFISSCANVKNQMYVPVLIVGFVLVFVLAEGMISGTIGGSVILLTAGGILLPAVSAVGVYGSYRSWCCQ
ncbi:MAG: hypothetical protein IJ468_01375 [Lachnospiraceae bacterium]|nr:hypothetical protein [Lachnospiraceae bacterium]